MDRVCVVDLSAPSYLAPTQAECVVTVSVAADSQDLREAVSDARTLMAVSNAAVGVFAVAFAWATVFWLRRCAGAISGRTLKE